MVRNGIFFLLLVTLPHAGFSQVLSSSKRALSSYAQANTAIENRQLATAVAHLQKALSFDSEFAEAHQVLGDIYRQKRDNEESIAHYLEVTRLKPYLTANTWFGLGECYLRLANYEKALQYLLQYKKHFPQHAASNKWTENYLENCYFSIDYSRDEINNTIKRLPSSINSAHDEYFPQLTADQRTMIFTRKVNNLESFYESTKDLEDQWTDALLLLGEINSSQYNEGAHCISPDGNYLFFTGCNRPGGMGSCDIYVSKREENGWGKPRNLGPPVNSSGWEAQPALSADGRTLYFVSNRLGGMGGYDIWKTDLQEDGHWAPPVNLGPQINTPFDESSPFIHADNRTLYFSSDGWPGFGDKDLFMSAVDSAGQWSTPQNLGSIINNHLEQNAVSVAMSGQMAYFSSAANEDKTDLDIFEIVLETSQRPQPVAYLNGTVLDAETGKALHAQVLIADLGTDESRFHAFTDRNSGAFLAPLTQGQSYALHISHPGYLFYSENYRLDTMQQSQDSYGLIVHLQAIKTGHTEILNNIFFDIDQSTLLEESKHELYTLIAFLTQNSTLSIEIGGHTDGTGSASHNQNLSEARAKSVWDFLLAHGIAENRVSYRGYGQDNPIANNGTEEGRQLNRRTDFKIIDLQP